jgi:hypothetical protein
MMHVAQPQALTNALSYPRCNCPSSPSRGAQACTACQGRFTLTAGPAQDPSVLVPPPHPQAFSIKLKWSVVVTYKFAQLDPGGVTSGTLDPVIAVAPIDQVGIAWPDVLSIAAWRKLAWTDCLAAALLPLPITLLCLWGAIASLPSFGAAGVFAAIALVFGLLTAYLFRSPTSSNLSVSRRGSSRRTTATRITSSASSRRSDSSSNASIRPSRGSRAHRMRRRRAPRLRHRSPTRGARRNRQGRPRRPAARSTGPRKSARGGAPRRHGPQAP